ncbi:hypothetical protein WOA01_11055 [Methylocystis sp. IM2]|jgi:hypothetical protein|nr:MAG: hypothetical protein EKK29_06815 [Hyphomicrobiales bacterium]
MTLFTWATPAFVSGAPVDHTWVTSYDSRLNPFPDIQAVIAAHEDFWYCWGGFHSQGRALGSRNGDLNLARCLVTPNSDSVAVYAARGTIFTYGVDGVCHQLANQVLYATGVSGAALTVAGAKGYPVSIAIYGTYGLQHAAWQSKIAGCTGGGHPLTTGPSMTTPSPQPDEFAAQVGQVLGSKLDVAAQLLHLRAQFQASAAAQAHSLVLPTVDELNARNQNFLDEAAKLLSEDEYFDIFGIRPGEKINLVLPAKP